MTNYCKNCGRYLPDDHSYRVKISVDAVFDLEEEARGIDRADLSSEFIKGIVASRVRGALEEWGYRMDLNAISIREIERID